MANEPKLVELGFDDQVLDLINKERAKVGVKALIDSGTRDNAADAHALFMAKNMTLSETGENGSSVASRAKENGFGSTNVAEALATGPMTPAEVVQQWLNDPAQRDKLLNPTFTEAGLGTVADANGKLWWDEAFGGPEVAPTPAPAPVTPDPTPTPVAVTPDPMTPPADPVMEPAKDPMEKGKGGGNKKEFRKKEFRKKEFRKKEFRKKNDLGDKKNDLGDKKNDLGNKKNDLGDKKNDLGDKKKFGDKQAGKDILGDIKVGDAKDFQPSKDPANGGGKDPIKMDMSFSPKDCKNFKDMNGNQIIGDVKNFQPMNDPMGAPQNPMGNPDMMSAPQNPLVMH